MNTATSSPTQWKAPAEDGRILIWPEPRSLLEQTKDNHRDLSRQQLQLQHIPLTELRSAQRQAIGIDDGQPLVATGHQVELIHPGVWAKNILVNQLADKLEGGRAVHFAVDTDAPKHLNLRWPGTGGDKGGNVPMTDDPGLGKAQWSGLLAGPSPAYLGQLASLLAETGRRWPFAPMTGPMFDAMAEPDQQDWSLPRRLANGIHAIDRQLGLRHEALQVSPLLTGRPYWVLVYHILARARSFAAGYNEILRQFRRENGISNPGRPWPDLRDDDDSCEAPFWLDDLKTSQRERAVVHRRGDRWVLQVPGTDGFELSESTDGWAAADALGQFLLSRGLRLSPRAMTLMLFFRLLVVDQFVHGIGGGQYDQLTDQVIERWFGTTAPAFAVSTATLYFPLAVGRANDWPRELDRLIIEGRRLCHASDDGQKRALAMRISQMPRRSSQRQQAFARMHLGLASVMRGQPYRLWEHRLEEARQQARRDAELRDRELFFALQPRTRLEGLIDRYRQEFS